MPNKYAEIIERIRNRTGVPTSYSLTEEEIAEFELWQGYSLPADYREFARDYTGLSVKACFQCQDARLERKKESIRVFFQLDPFSKWLTKATLLSACPPFELAQAPTLRQVLELGETITSIPASPREFLAVGIGEKSLYLALAGKYPGAVFLWPELHNGDHYGDIYFVADSFDEFMHSLQKEH